MNDDWVEASVGEGAWFVRSNGEAQRLQIRTQVADDDLVGMFSPFLFKDDALRHHAALLQPKYARTIALRCCCHEYRTMVQGNVDFSVSPKPNVWDHAAGILAYQEAGGVVQMIDGSAYRPSIREGVIVAGRNADVVERVCQDFVSFI